VYAKAQGLTRNRFHRPNHVSDAALRRRTPFGDQPLE
jgi:hypothetical protein